jgi:citrate synthase
LVLCTAQTLKETLQEVIPAKQEQLKQLVRVISSEPCAHPSIL